MLTTRPDHGLVRESPAELESEKDQRKRQRPNEAHPPKTKAPARPARAAGPA